MLLVTSDDIMTPLFKNLTISSKIHAVKPLCSVSKLSTESVGSRRELVANCVHTAHATQLDSCVASTSAVCIGQFLGLNRSIDLSIFRVRSVSQRPNLRQEDEEDDLMLQKGSDVKSLKSGGQRRRPAPRTLQESLVKSERGSAGHSELNA